MIRQRRIQKRKPAISMSSQEPIPFYPPGPPYKIALLQPGSYGDNVNSTLMLKPLKAKWPDCIIDVFTSTLYASAFYNNPLINKIHETPANTKQNALHQLHTTLPLIENRGYDKIFRPHPMLNPDKWTSARNDLGTNLIYAWVRALEDADVPYTLPLETILHLTPQEISRVDQFCAGIDMGKRKNIMEIHGESGQTYWNDAWTKAAIDKLCSRGEIVFVSHKIGVPELAVKYPGLCINANVLSIRECAELFNRCDKFFSVSSGLSNTCNTNWCKKDIEWIEVINSEVVSSAPIRTDRKKFWYDNDINRFIDTL